MTKPRFNQAHDHNLCIKIALDRAENICKKKDVRLTRLRKKILELIWQSHAPLGAYDLMDMLQATSDRERVAPPTVYRSLDFLLEQGLIHKVHSLNAYIGCNSPAQTHSNALFICSTCGYTDEVHSSTIQQAINLGASQNRFSVRTHVLEVLGLCERCR